MRKIFLKYVPFCVGMFLFMHCKTEGVKLDYEDRVVVDTLVTRQIVGLAIEMDKWCKDSSPVLRQRMVDSLMKVREQEIMNSIPPPQY